MHIGAGLASSIHLLSSAWLVLRKAITRVRCLCLSLAPHLLHTLDHNYMLVGASGGCCDCGDEDSWKASGYLKGTPTFLVLTCVASYCPDHTGFPENDPSLLLPADIRSRAHTVIRYWLSLVSKHFAGIDDSLRDFIAWLTRLLACGDGFRRIINQVR